jgi:peptidoglycan/xylan/chitin deacetylase (PgdA/CDA1 family)
MVVSDPLYDLPRDLEGTPSPLFLPNHSFSNSNPGYGEESLNPRWPGGAKIAISFILNYEEGAERTILNGDAHSEPYLWEKGASSSFLTGARHMAAESEFEYGSRVGAWRILRLFKEMGYRFTTWAVSQATAKNPSFAKVCVRDGHEIAAHGARWLDISHMSVAEEKEYIKENCLVLEKLTGKFPKGYFYGRGTPNTRALWPQVVKEIGEKRGTGERLGYSSEAFNDDVPYWVDLPAEVGMKDEEKEGMLVVPYNYDCNGTSSLPLPQNSSSKNKREQKMRRLIT